MRLFALKDRNDPDASVLAVLSCYGPEPDYYIDMPCGTDPWTVPLVLSSFAARGQWVVGREWSRRWVESRLVPRSRQNLGEVFKENGLQSYDTLRLLELTCGMNSQDDCYLDSLAVQRAPAWFKEREAGRIVDAVSLPQNRVLVAFRAGDVLLCDIGQLADANPGLARALSSEDAFARMEVTPGGREVRWGTAVALGDFELRTCGKPVGLTWEDLAGIAPALLVDAAEAADMLGCSRQNVNALVKRGALPAAKKGGKSTLLLRADVRSRLE